MVNIISIYVVHAPLEEMLGTLAKLIAPQQARMTKPDHDVPADVGPLTCKTPAAPAHRPRVLPNQYYAQRRTVPTSDDECACAPCVTKTQKNVHGGYWQLMANPGSYCSLERQQNADTACASPQHTFRHLFTNSTALRGKSMLLVGDSVMAQVFFAMLCSLYSHGLVNETSLLLDKVPGGRWPTSRVFYKLPWSKGFRLTAQAGGAHVAYVSHYESNMRVCTSSLAREPRPRPPPDMCVEYIVEAARRFDVLLVMPPQGTLAKQLKIPQADALFASLATVQPAKGKRHIVMQPSALHFQTKGAARSGLYVERDEAAPESANASVSTCACHPSAADARVPTARGEHLDALAKRYRTIRVLPYWKLTQPMWSMHLAHTIKRGSSSNFACDCLHFCYAPQWWSGVFAPALARSLADDP